MAAYWDQMAERESKLSDLLEQYPLECTPWGLWDARDLDMQERVMKEVRQAQFCWMCAARRLGVPKDVALIICGFVCTRSGWKQ